MTEVKIDTKMHPAEAELSNYLNHLIKDEAGKIKDVVVISLDDIRSPLESISEDKRKYIYGETIINERVVVVLKAEELFSQTRLAVI